MLPTVYAKGNKRTIQNLAELRKLAHADKAPRVALRIQGIMLSLEKHSASQIAKLLHVHRSTVHQWIAAWNEHRELGLLEGHRSGRRSSLSDENIETLSDIVDSGPVAYGLDTGVWTSPIIAQVIESEFGVAYNPGHVRKLLKQIGFSVQRPRAKLIRADQREQNKWTRYSYPNLKKKPCKKKR